MVLLKIDILSDAGKPARTILWGRMRDIPRSGHPGPG